LLLHLAVNWEAFTINKFNNKQRISVSRSGKD